MSTPAPDEPRFLVVQTYVDDVSAEVGEPTDAITALKRFNDCCNRGVAERVLLVDEHRQRQLEWVAGRGSCFLIRT